MHHCIRVGHLCGLPGTVPVAGPTLLRLQSSALLASPLNNPQPPAGPPPAVALGSLSKAKKRFLALVRFLFTVSGVCAAGNVPEQLPPVALSGGPRVSGSPTGSGDQNQPWRLVDDGYLISIPQILPLSQPKEGGAGMRNQQHDNKRS
ncbi:hypothetical protein AK830_g6657 [Neonectria ditissima]|uniref:Uncharacterized protein n=1 Tax=Neonectria ditissima TaxID=78410 RepID=A0A0P7AQ22_9HYPO|nr:hypothetical protein AK830_g6657 [Neonectria ditissima]